MIINVRVKPSSKKQEIKKLGNVYEVSVKSKAEDNKANIELLKLLKKEFKKDFVIIKGIKNKEKVCKCQ